MASKMIKGRISSIQTMGTLDGPGVRFVVFMQGCNLRCGCCHNPETWQTDGGTEYTPAELAQKAENYREYFGKTGGVTLSGGEPLLQALFAAEFFKECHIRGINTCLDTSGSVLNGAVLELLRHTDRVLLDIKYTTDEKYRKYAGCGIDEPFKFLEIANRKKIPVTLRQVIIPTLNDDEENIKKLKKIISQHSLVDKVELLPFKKLCGVKYEKMGIRFPFKEIPEPTSEKMEELQALLCFG